MLFELFNNKCSGKHLVSTYLCLPLCYIVQKDYHLISTTTKHSSFLQIINHKIEA